MLKRIQAELPKLWTNEDYSKEFNASPSKYKDFQHALAHVSKAVGRLWEMVELADHCPAENVEPHFDQADVKKYLADLVICSLRMAVKNPTGEIDLEKAVFDRIEEKMKVRLDK